MFPGETFRSYKNNLNASADFAYWVIFFTFSSMMGHFSHFRFPEQIQPTLIKNNETNDAFYVPAHYCFPRRILQPLTNKKRTLKQDSSLWVISLIMSSTWGHFVFFRSASKQLRAALLSWRPTPAAIAENHVARKTWNWCHLGKPHLLPSRTDSATPRELFFANHIDAFVVHAGPVFLLSRFTPWQQKASLLTHPKKP